MCHMRDSYYFILEKKTEIPCLTLVDDIDIDKYIDKSELNKSAFNELSPTLTERVLEAVVIKRRELMFHLD